MKVLAVETSTMCGSVALLEEEKLISEYLLDIKTTHSERLMPAIDRVLKDSEVDLSQIDGFAVSLGPGSFTGLRIGLSAIKGLALAMNKPIAGIPTLDALAHNIPFSRYTISPLLDARRGEVYTALYRFNEKGELSRVTSYRAMDPRHWLTFIDDKTVFLGGGLTVYRWMVEEELKDFAIFAPADLNVPRASVVGRC